MSMDPALQTFLGECQDLLQELEDGLLVLEEQPDDDETLNALFRAAHTIKGSAGIFGLDPISSFTHRVENVLSRMRDGELTINGELAGLLLSCRDHIRALVTRLVEEGGEVDAGMESEGAALTKRLGVYLDEPPAETPTATAEQSTTTTAGAWHISLRFGDDVLRMGMDPLAFLRYLRKLGEITHVAISDTLPTAAEMDPEGCYLGFELRLEGETDQAAIEDVFEFVRDDCELRILPPDATPEAWKQLLSALPEGSDRATELLTEAGADLSEPEPEPQPEPTATPASTPTEENKAAPTAKKGGANKGGGTLRVDAERLDQLINLVGELVIAVAGTDVQARRTGQELLRESVEGMSRLVEEIRDTSLKLRMVPIGETFRRFQRVVRDGARDLGKQVELITYGADTELDKVVSERISDPLMHLVRNAVDHGMETPEVRRAAGKPEMGSIVLEAYYDSGSIVIEINDDGAGLNAERIAAKALERGLIEAGQQLSEQEIHRLIFEAGFSTAEKVSNLSGRGVGMDVVRRNIEALRGSVDVESTPGEGSTFRIRLPLTLSIIDGFLLKVGGTAYVVPLEMLVECIEVGDEECRINEEHDYLDLRGEVLPFLRMNQLFAADDAAPSRENIVVVQYGEYKAGLVVDELLGETQAVIKPLGLIFQRLRGISGATILGSGEVALILDIPGLVQRAADGGNGAGTGMGATLGTGIGGAIGAGATIN